MTTQERNPTVPAAGLETVPVEGCRICAAASNRREGARGRGDTWGVRRYGDMIAEHPHRRSTDGKPVRPW